MKFFIGMIFVLVLRMRSLMPGCTHGGVARGRACPSCGRTA